MRFLYNVVHNISIVIQWVHCVICWWWIIRFNEVNYFLCRQYYNIDIYSMYITLRKYYNDIILLCHIYSMMPLYNKRYHSLNKILIQIIRYRGSLLFHFGVLRPMLSSIVFHLQLLAYTCSEFNKLNVNQSRLY